VEIELVNSKVTVFAITRFHVNRLVRFVVSQGVREANINILSTSFSFSIGRARAATILAELKARYPIAYNQGWVEPDTDTFQTEV